MAAQGKAQAKATGMDPDAKGEAMLADPTAHLAILIPYRIALGT